MPVLFFVNNPLGLSGCVIEESKNGSQAYQEAIMRNKVFILAILTIFIFISILTAEVDKDAVAEKIKKISSYLDKPGGPGSDGVLMFTMLLEAILETAPDTNFPPEFTENMKKAKEISDSESFLSPDGVVYLRKARRLINDGEEFKMPSSISEIQDAVNYAQIELGWARKYIKIGKNEDCIRKLLDISVMIVTPMHKEL
jgi:hypothetical protein